MAKQKHKIDLQGSIVIENIKKLKEAFDKSAGMGQVQIVSSEEISEVDLTGVQWMQYVIDQTAAKGIKTEWKVKLSEDQKLMLQKNGFSNIIDTLFT